MFILVSPCGSARNVEGVDMSGLNIFFNAQKYLTDCVRDSLASMDLEQLKNLFSILIEGRTHHIIVDGQGRSLQSILLVEDCLEHNGFPIILPAANAALRPWDRNDIFFFNSGSGSGSPITHAQAAKKDGLRVIGMTYNANIIEEFPDVLVLESSKNKNPLYAPLGTEFEIASAVLGACIGYSVRDTVAESIDSFQQAAQKIVDLFDTSHMYFEENLEMLMSFIGLISTYIPADSQNYVYFRGVGRDAIINSVAAIRYGHLRKEPDKDLRVIFEGHWDLRKEGDLAIITSGSGSTPQTMDYALQSFVSGMKIFGITSFGDSDLGRFARRCDGCLVVPGRKDPFSMYNMVGTQRKNYLPEFELNVYITLDSLLSQIASNHGITEDDMRKSHRLKALE
jgi:D-arabinose 5-phosphate isomerase GutQ